LILIKSHTAHSELAATTEPVVIWHHQTRNPAAPDRALSSSASALALPWRLPPPRNPGAPQPQLLLAHWERIVLWRGGAPPYVVSTKFYSLCHHQLLVLRSELASLGRCDLPLWSGLVIVVLPRCSSATALVAASVSRLAPLGRRPWRPHWTPANV